MVVCVREPGAKLAMRVTSQLSVVLLASLSLVSTASAQLRADQVLVVFDDRIPDSAAVASAYAAARPGVRLVNLNTVRPPIGEPQVPPPLLGPGNATYQQFIDGLRKPLRDHLASRGLTTAIRSIVLTKGLPHRITDINNAGAGDSPATAQTLQNAGNYTAASVDAELCLLWQNLSANERNGGGDSRADGYIWNPYFKSTQPINSFSNANIGFAKTLVNANVNIYPPGLAWRSAGTAGTAALTAGDFYLVCRLDGRTVADVQALINRSVAPRVDLSTAFILLDESGNLPFEACTPAVTEFDNNNFIDIYGGDDFERTRDHIIGRTTVAVPPAPIGSCTSATARDFRFPIANILYNSSPGTTSFFVGPRVGVATGNLIVSNPVLVISTEGANHGGGIPVNGQFFPASFNYTQGAFFNSIESYNGRDFGGLGGFGIQGQVADFITAGGTFALANVNEPFTITEPKTNLFVRNFVQGSLSFAEAAYSALPVLSYQQIAIGDPLARLVRSTDDVNGDGLLNIDDLYAWHASQRDTNGDGLINSTDRRAQESLQRAIEPLFMSSPQR